MSRRIGKKRKGLCYIQIKKQLKKSLNIGKYVIPVARCFDVNSDRIDDLVLFDHGKNKKDTFLLLDLDQS